MCGGRWALAGERHVGEFGQPSTFREVFSCKSLDITLYTRQKLSPALIWHFYMLLRLTGEYYAAKQRERELQQMSYVQAVHETGARLTHDVKNLLQSLNNICFIAEGEDPSRTSLLLQRQLPQITKRLQQTLEKLQAPFSQQGEGGNDVLAATWWSALPQRYASDGIDFYPAAFEPGVNVSAFLFDSVVDNLVQNAMLKRQSENGLRISVSLSPDGRVLRVCDSGSAVRKEIVADLFDAPVASENGLGIGLYHAARQAEGFGYTLRLASNEDGKVCFELAKNQPEKPS